MNNLEDLQDMLGYKFNNLALLNTALTHVSYANDNNIIGYDRLEFLGDSIIGYLVADYLYNNLKSNAGELTKLRASLVSTENFQKISKQLKLDTYVLKSKSLPVISKKNTADLFESVIGAVYLDGGMDKCKELVYRYVIISGDHINNALLCSIDYKTKFQELMQSKAMVYKYEVIGSSGKDHEKIFTVALSINDQVVSTAKGTSIQNAEESCAEKYLKNAKS